MVDAAHSSGGGAVAPEDTVAYLVYGASIAETRSARGGRVVYDGGVFDDRAARVVVNTAAMGCSVIGYQTVGYKSRIVDKDTSAIKVGDIVGE